LRVETADQTPEFFSLRVEEDECGCEFKTINRREVFANLFLNIQADENNAVSKFFFEPVNGGLCGGAANSVWRLKFEQDGLSCADQGIYSLGITHEGCLNRVQDDPRSDESRDDRPEGEKIPPGGGVSQQDQACHDDYCQSE
jgi:hypothetical protein